MSARRAGAKKPGIKGAIDGNIPAVLVRRHLRIGWWSLLFFLILGIGLESLHGFKAGWYLNVSNSTRRLMLTLAHAHGTLIGLMHIGFAATISQWAPEKSAMRRLAANCLLCAGVLVPAGFFLAGVAIEGNEPGLGIVLVPAGALALVAAVWLTARGAKGARMSAAEFTSQG